MGCCESSEEPRDAVYLARNIAHRPQTITEYRRSTVIPVQVPRPEEKPYYGKFKCHSCNRNWDSRFCWPDKYQLCKGCSCRVYPYTHRELDSRDFIEEADKTKEHQMELCQKCQELGRLCIINKKLPRKQRYHY